MRELWIKISLDWGMSKTCVSSEEQKFSPLAPATWLFRPSAGGHLRHEILYYIPGQVHLRI